MPSNRTLVLGGRGRGRGCAALLVLALVLLLGPAHSPARASALGLGLGLTNPGALHCIRRLYSFRVTKTDSMGRSCWDDVRVWSCWGRCDSNEVADWRFPFKRSHHPVCLHDQRQTHSTTLRYCDPDVERGTEHYEFLSAKACRCMVCKSSEASCEGMRGQRPGAPPGTGSGTGTGLSAQGSFSDTGPTSMELIGPVDEDLADAM